jgi:hypothetical protein
MPTTAIESVAPILKTKLSRIYAEAHAPPVVPSPSSRAQSISMQGSSHSPKTLSISVTLTPSSPSNRSSSPAAPASHFFAPAQGESASEPPPARKFPPPSPQLSAVPEAPNFGLSPVGAGGAARLPMPGLQRSSSMGILSTATHAQSNKGPEKLLTPSRRQTEAALSPVLPSPGGPKTGSSGGPPSMMRMRSFSFDVPHAQALSPGDGGLGSGVGGGYAGAALDRDGLHLNSVEDLEEVLGRQSRSLVTADELLRLFAGPSRIGKYRNCPSTVVAREPTFVLSISFERLRHVLGALLPAVRPFVHLRVSLREPAAARPDWALAILRGPLDKVHFLDMLSVELRLRLSNHLALETIPAGTIIYRQGSAVTTGANKMYIVLSGSVSLMKRPDPNRKKKVKRRKQRPFAPGPDYEAIDKVGVVIAVALIESSPRASSTDRAHARVHAQRM